MLAHINDFLRKNSVFGFITMVYCLFNRKTGELNFTNAGYLPPYLVSENAIRPISDQRGVVMGIKDTPPPQDIDRHFATVNIKLKKNEKVVIYSSGFLKAIGIKDLSDLSLLEELLKKYADFSAEDMLAAIQLNLKNTPKTDDITVVCLEISE